jgi:hypothetical protein
MHAQAMWKGILQTLWRLLLMVFSGDIFTAFEAAFATISIFILIIFYRKMRFSYWLFSMFSIFIPLSTGIMSMPRYILVIFPLYILFADITKNRVSEVYFYSDFLPFSGLFDDILDYWLQIGDVNNASLKFDRLQAFHISSGLSNKSHIKNYDTCDDNNTAKYFTGVNLFRSINLDKIRMRTIFSEYLHKTDLTGCS